MSRLAAGGAESAWVSPSKETPDMRQGFRAAQVSCATGLRVKSATRPAPADHAGELADFALLVVAKPHQQRHRRVDQFLHFGAAGVDVDLAAETCLVRATGSHHVAKRGFDRGPIFGLVRGEPQPALEAGNLAVIEQSARRGRGGRRRSCLGLSWGLSARRRRCSLGLAALASATGAGSAAGIEGVAAIAGLAGRSISTSGCAEASV